jgi:molybdopterin/thiamine biosynthesis adenylyltransferase
MLKAEELKRYDRQIMIPEIGEAGQEKLKEARVFVAGAGGLGSSVSIYLAAAGVGGIRLADHDRVEVSNLNRQILHWDEDVGRKKVDSASEKLRRMNPYVKVEIVDKTITEDNVKDLTAGCDAIVDAMDNLPTRFILNRAAVALRIPFFHGAVRGLEGRAMTVIPGKSACLRCLYRGPGPQEKFPVLGATPAVIGCIQATEVIKYLTEAGELLVNRLLIYDGLNLRFAEFKVSRNPECEHCAHVAKEE